MTNGVPRPAEPARQTLPSVNARVETAPPSRVARLPQRTTFCRAGFAGRGTPFASGAGRHTLASDPDPRRSLGPAR